jgi:tetratricopeptide (TPR) repeat protein
VKKFNITVVIVFISLIITGFLIFINDIVISIRLNELKADLLEQDLSESSLDHIGLVATYQIHKNIYERKLTQENADAIEGKILSLLKSEERNNPAIVPTKYKIISRPALWIINFNRKIIGKAPLTYYQSGDQNLADLDIAYYYERNFLFNRAIERYGKALENSNINNTLRASILLHQGYCYALAGLNDKALNNYSIIINKYGQESSAITATILSRYLEGFKLARERVLSSNADPLLRSQDLVNLLAYEQALNILGEAELRAKPGDIPRIKYFIGRCFTGLGKPEKAVENYLQVIVSSPTSQYARYSNRKLFIIGSREGGENKIMKISKQLNNKLKDPVLSQMIQNRKDTPESADDTKNAEVINVPKALMEKVDKITENKEKTAEVGTYLVILTSDGNTFKGKLIEQNKEEVSLQTSIGRINVKREKITSITVKN